MSSDKHHQILSISKEEFIDRISKMSPEEINKFILENGKPPKLIEPIIFFDDKGRKIPYPNNEEV